jgi:tetratricopeptide (TPR) repeat protein
MTSKLSGLINSVDRLKIWDTIQSSNDPNDFAAYLVLKNSQQEHAQAAEIRLKDLMSSTVKAVGLQPLEAQGLPPETSAIARQGERLFYEGAYTEAEKEFKKLLLTRPSDPLVIYDYATCLLHLNRPDEATELLSHSADLNPAFPWSYFNRGVARYLAGNSRQAIDDFQLALEHKPDYAPGYNNLALAKRDAGDFKGAEEAVSTAKALNPFYAPTFFNSAVIFFDLGTTSAALADQKRGETLIIPGKM